MSRFFFVVAVLLCAGSFAAQIDKNKIQIATTSGNAYYVISSQGLSNAEARKDWTHKEMLAKDGATAKDWKDSGCRGKLGDGWHVPSVEDYEKDHADLDGSLIATDLSGKRLWLLDTVARRDAENRKTEAYYAASLSASLSAKAVEKISLTKDTKLATACVCGEQVSDNHYRRAKGQCLKFSPEDHSASYPENADFVLKSGGSPVKTDRNGALAVCRDRNKRVPSLLELAILNPQIQSRLSPAGCVWSESESGDARLPYHYWKIETKEVFKSTANQPCAVVCVL